MKVVNNTLSVWDVGKPHIYKNKFANVNYYVYICLHKPINMNYEIKITGSGTAKEIAEALKAVVKNLESATNGKHETALLDGAEWEDATLVTTINAQ